jgi:hypothetical protein
MPPTQDDGDLANSEASAHIAQLHKMSPTAGVTNRGYVEVNHLAIVAVVLGIASLLALLDIYLLAIPVAAIIFAVIAFAKIGDSNGTQTGRGLAIIGLALALLLGGGETVKEAMKQAAIREDEQQVSATLVHVGELIRDGKYDEAYALFDDHFHSYVKPELFKSNLISVQAPRSLGPLLSMDSNGIVKFETARGLPKAVTRAKIAFTKVPDERFDVELLKVGGKWRILSFPFFTEPPPASKDNFDF